MVFWVEIFAKFYCQAFIVCVSKLSILLCSSILNFQIVEEDTSINREIFAGILGSLAALGIGIVIGLYAIGMFIDI